ncbi:MAG: hypothetical protein COV52_01450 [Gammaproteobacteria bacterium CG11_big_fil_rev_8_21_14_0_20_46_22]|nr:MAG: hypothetical protein COW05_03175 [Gammaproteobacteria bacterium CG12_big_fil_rev_8_21_14_0_65_46_12]PIR11920.1 MAG: hypothetical protein COV52_01450 [Gammaproteobacteria bacterium CG11_big_fil_rev_8_21_14_0_20_46_22]
MYEKMSVPPSVNVVIALDTDCTLTTGIPDALPTTLRERLERARFNVDDVLLTTRYPDRNHDDHDELIPSDMYCPNRYQITAFIQLAKMAGIVVVCASNKVEHSEADSRFMYDDQLAFYRHFFPERLASELCRTAAQVAKRYEAILKSRPQFQSDDANGVRDHGKLDIIRAIKALYPDSRVLLVDDTVEYNPSDEKFRASKFPDEPAPEYAFFQMSSRRSHNRSFDNAEYLRVLLELMSPEKLYYLLDQPDASIIKSEVRREFAFNPVLLKALRQCKVFTSLIQSTHQLKEPLARAAEIIEAIEAANHSDSLRRALLLIVFEEFALPLAKALSKQSASDDIRTLSVSDGAAQNKAERLSRPRKLLDELFGLFHTPARLSINEFTAYFRHTHCAAKDRDEAWLFIELCRANPQWRDMNTVIDAQLRDMAFNECDSPMFLQSLDGFSYLLACRVGEETYENELKSLSSSLKAIVSKYEKSLKEALSSNHQTYIIDPETVAELVVEVFNSVLTQKKFLKALSGGLDGVLGAGFFKYSPQTVMVLFVNLIVWPVLNQALTEKLGGDADAARFILRGTFKTLARLNKFEPSGEAYVAHAMVAHLLQNSPKSDTFKQRYLILMMSLLPTQTASLSGVFERGLSHCVSFVPPQASGDEPVISAPRHPALEQYDLLRMKEGIIDRQSAEILIQTNRAGKADDRASRAERQGRIRTGCQRFGVRLGVHYGVDTLISLIMVGVLYAADLPGYALLVLFEVLGPFISAGIHTGVAEGTKCGGLAEKRMLKLSEPCWARCFGRSRPEQALADAGATHADADTDTYGAPNIV